MHSVLHWAALTCGSAALTCGFAAPRLHCVDAVCAVPCCTLCAAPCCTDLWKCCTMSEMRWMHSARHSSLCWYSCAFCSRSFAHRTFSADAIDVIRFSRICKRLKSICYQHLRRTLRNIHERKSRIEALVSKRLTEMSHSRVPSQGPAGFELRETLI